MSRYPIAILALEKSTELFGEYSDSWSFLAESYYKNNQVWKGEFHLPSNLSSLNEEPLDCLQNR
jgi:hypothetical protein